MARKAGLDGELKFTVGLCYLPLLVFGYAGLNADRIGLGIVTGLITSLLFGIGMHRQARKMQAYRNGLGGGPN